MTDADLPVFAITGAKGTGKSTTLGALQERLPAAFPDKKLRFVESPGAQAKRANLPLGESGSDGTHLFMAELHLRSLLYINDSELVFLDRCFVDHLAYVRVLSQDPNLISLMNHIMALAAPRYAAVFACPLHAGLPDPNAQTETMAFRDRIQSEICAILESYRINCINLPQSTDEAVTTIQASIGDF